MNLNDIKLERIDGTKESMADYAGNVILIVNTASKCGFTPQYEELEAIYQKYHDKGLEILAFPCNQFKEQEPEENAKIEAFCRKNYGVTFPLFSKTEVKGENAHPLYRMLTKEQGFKGFDEGHPLTGKLKEILSSEDSSYEENSDIKWNFTKFLIDRNQTVAGRFEPTAKMEKVEEEIEKLL